MARVTRQAVVHVYDVLAGCRTLLLPVATVGQSVETYVVLLERVLDLYFFGDCQGGLDHLAEYIENVYGVEPPISAEICSYMERELIRRIQNTFIQIYPSRHYHFKVNDNLTTVEITESNELPRLDIIDEPLDETDAWVPERLRR